MKICSYLHVVKIP